MPLLILGLFLSFMFTFSLLADNSKTLFLDYRAEQLKEGISEIRKSAENYYLETGTWPSSLEALSGLPNYHHLKKYVPAGSGGFLKSVNSPWKIDLGAVKTDSLGGYRYREIAVYAYLFRNNNATNFADNSVCPLSSAIRLSNEINKVSCQGNDVFISFTSDLGLKFELEKKAYRQQMYAGKKISTLKKAGQTLPVVSSFTSLRSLVTPGAGASVGTSFATCTGIFHWQGAGFECIDLYNYFGNVVEVQIPNQTTLTLRSNSIILSTAGTPLVLTTNITH